MTEKKETCACCGGGGKVLSIFNEIRPCSRCDVTGFDAWAKARIAKRDDPIAYRPLGEEAK